MAPRFKGTPVDVEEGRTAAPRFKGVPVEQSEANTAQQPASGYEPIARTPGGVRMTRGGLVGGRPSVQEQMDTLEATARGAVQGATLGAGDEIYGAAVGAGNWLTGNGYLEHYERARDENREANQAAQEAHPWAYGAGQVGGGLATMAVGGVPALSAKAATLGGRIGLGAIEGAGYGAVQGFNDGEGTIGDKVESGLWGAGSGAVVGAGLPAVASGVGAGARWVMNSEPLPEVLRPFSRGAVNRVSRAFGDDAAAGFNYADEVTRMLPEQMPLDLSGMNVRTQVEGIASQPGLGGARIARSLNERSAGAADRIRTVTDNALGTTAGRRAERDTLLEARRSNISPLYERAREHAAPLDVREAINLIDDALLTAAGKKKEALQNIKGQLLNDGIPKSSAAALHEVRSEIGRGMRNEWSDIAGALKPIQQKLDDQLDTIPGYAEARAQWADSKAIEEAQDAGAKAWNRNTRRDDMAAELADMTEAERRAYMLAARDAAAENMDNAGRSLGQIGADQESIRGAMATFGTRAGEDKLRMLSQTPEAGEAAVRRIQGEAAMASRAHEILGNSRTAARTAAQKEFPSTAEVGFNRNLAPATATGLTIAGLDWLARKGTMGLLDAHRARIAGDTARIYTTAGSQRDRVVQALLARGPQVLENNAKAENIRRIAEALLNGRTGGVVAPDPEPLFFTVKPKGAR